MDTRAFKKAIGEPFTRAGFSSKGQSWFIDAPDAVSVVNLQKSSYDDLHFLNLAFWLKAIGETPVPPPEHKCHVRVRASAQFPELATELDDLLASGSPLPDEERKARLAAVLDAVVIPWVKTCSTEGGLRAQYRVGQLGRAMIVLVARQVLEQPA